MEPAPLAVDFCQSRASGRAASFTRELVLLQAGNGPLSQPPDGKIAIDRRQETVHVLKKASPVWPRLALIGVSVMTCRSVMPLSKFFWPTIRSESGSRSPQYSQRGG